MNSYSPGPPISPESQPPRPPIDSGKVWHRRTALLSICLVTEINILVLTNFRLPFIEPALGFWFLILQPAYLLYRSALWPASSLGERLGYSLTAVLLLLMVGGLAANTLLPLLGVPRPLAPLPVLVLGDLLTVAAYLLRRRFPPAPSQRTAAHALQPAEGRLLFGSALCVVLAVLGANRLNNGAGDQISVAALGVSVVTLSLLLRWQQKVREGLTGITIYLVSLGLLLMTSLRGWYVTGHDIQREFLVFQFTAAHGHWNPAYHDAYNACLSLTILPTELAQVIHVDNPYIYKVFFQLIFAVCPVLVYTIARRYWSGPIAIIAAIYFISFPTFFNDMPFLNRQEIAFLFVCVAVLLLTNTALRLRQRQVAFLVACLGVELSHYASMYLLIGTLLAAWAIHQVVKLRDRHRPQARAGHSNVAPWAATMQTISVAPLLCAIAIIFTWGFLATHTAGKVLTDVESALSGVFGNSTGARSNDVGYSLLFWRTPTPQQLLNDYSHVALKTRAAAPTIYLPSPVVANYPVHAVKTPQLPLTTAGRLLTKIGLPVTAVNSIVRLAAAEGEQIFAGLGLLAVLLIPRLRQQISREYFCLCAGSIATLVAVTLLPGLSVDYGVLRVFQGALIFIAPVLVTGSIVAFQRLGMTWATRIAITICIGIFISTTGLLPQALGGYPAQLSLNNSGQYYNIYYKHPQEVAASAWLEKQQNAITASTQASFAATRFLFSDPAYVAERQFIGDAFPLLIRQEAYVIISYSVIHTGLAVAPYSGTLITYKYPLQFLWANKNLLYNNGGAEIYK